MEHIRLGNAVATKLASVRVVTHFQHPASNIAGMPGEEILNVVAVDRPPAVIAEASAYRRYRP
jgi:hypothetical protein